MPNLIGLHDREAIQIAPLDTWILDTIALSENPGVYQYSQQHHWICRANWGYGNTGTIPLPNQNETYLNRLYTYIKASSGCRRWIIGNEPNLPREWASGVPIHPTQYADLYVRAREMVHNIPGHGNDEVLIAGPGPWNNDYTYATNPIGDWLVYFRDVINYIGVQRIDGFSIHAYTHGYDKSLVRSEAMMNPPFQDHRYEFRTYIDTLNRIPNEAAHLPIYITEANGNGRWQAVGLMPEMADEINYHNQRNPNRKIMALIFYRYPTYDENAEFAISNKPDVITEFLNTVAKNYRSPELPKKQEQVFIPKIENPVTDISVYPVGTVTVESLNIRNAPGVENTTLVGSKFKGQQVRIMEEVTYENGERWYRIGVGQWVYAGYIDRLDSQLDNKSAIYQLIFTSWCRVLQLDPVVVQAILNVESGGNSFEGNRMIIRFENHIFLERVQSLNPNLLDQARSHFRHGNPSWMKHEWRLPSSSVWMPVHVGTQFAEWQVYEFARTIHVEAANQSISMGMGQIMGFNYHKVGFNSSQEMIDSYNDMEFGEFNQLTGFFAFIFNTEGLREAVQNKQWEKIALSYNGSGQVAHYSDLLSKEYRKLAGK